MAANYAPLSLQPVFYNGKVVVGAKIYVYTAGTNTPLETFSDGTTGALHTWPMLTNSNGVIPPFWVGVTDIKVVITNTNDTVIQSVDNIHIPTDSGGSTPTPLPATDIPTGFMMPAHTSGVVAGWVRANGLTIGNDVSGATERANEDTLDLFKVLWAKDTSLSVSGGRGSSAEADFAAGKRVALPDYRGKAIVGLDGMGAPVANLLSGVSFTVGSQNVLGSNGGAASVTLTASQMPKHSHAGSSLASAGAHTHTGDTVGAGTHTHVSSSADAGNHGHTISDAGHTHTEKGVTSSTSGGFAGGGIFTVVTGVSETSHQTSGNTTGISVVAGGDHRHTITVDNAGLHSHIVNTSSSGSHNHTLTIAESGADAAHSNMQPFMLSTIYIKL